MKQILEVGASLSGISVVMFALRAKRGPALDRGDMSAARIAWRMPALDTLGLIQMTPMRRIFMIVLRAYLVAAVTMVIVRVVQTAAA